MIRNKGDRERERFGRKDWGGFLPGGLKIALIGGRLTSPWRLQAGKRGKREDDERKKRKVGKTRRRICTGFEIKQIMSINKLTD